MNPQSILPASKIIVPRKPEPVPIYSVFGTCTIKVTKEGFIFSDKNDAVEIKSKFFESLLKILKTIYTTDVNERVGRVIQISKTHVCFFKLDAAHFTCRNSQNSIPVKYEHFDEICKFLEEKGFESEKFFKFERVILKNFVRITGCLKQDKRKLILEAMRDNQEQFVEEIVTTLLESSNLRAKNVFFRETAKTLIKENISLLELLSYARKVTHGT